MDESGVQRPLDSSKYADAEDLAQNTLFTIENSQTSPNVSIVSSPFDKVQRHSPLHQQLPTASHRSKTNSLVLYGPSVEQSLEHQRATPSFFNSPQGAAEGSNDPVSGVGN